MSLTMLRWEEAMSWENFWLLRCSRKRNHNVDSRAHIDFWKKKSCLFLITCTCAISAVKVLSLLKVEGEYQMKSFFACTSR